MRVLDRAVDYMNHMDLEESQHQEIRVAHSQINLLHHRLSEFEEKIESQLLASDRASAAELLREAMSVRQELLLWMTRGFSLIVKVFLPVLFSEEAPESTL